MDFEVFHAHVYFGQETKSQALALYEKAKAELDLKVGRFHEKPVGPHPVWSFQILVPSSELNTAMSWIIRNHGELSVLFHPVGEDDLQDHTEYAMWLGKPYELNLDAF